tara:strand:+ start:890 stop:2206 length:1317 start_codon:yes stop_codon:yes gene_type:complete
MKYFGGNLLSNLEETLDNTINNQDDRITNYTQSINEEIQKQERKQLKEKQHKKFKQREIERSRQQQLEQYKQTNLKQSTQRPTQSVNELMQHFMIQPEKQYTQQPINNLIDQQIQQQMQQPMNNSIDQQMEQPIYNSIDQQMQQSMNNSIDQSIQQINLSNIINNEDNNNQIDSQIINNSELMSTYKPLDVSTLSPSELNYMKTKQPFLDTDNNNNYFKAMTQSGLQDFSENISTNKPMIIEEATNPPTTIYPIRNEQHNAAKINDDTTLRPIEIARNLSKKLYPKENKPSYIGHQKSLLANSAFVLGSNETSIFPDIKEIPLNVELNISPYDASVIGSISKKLDGTTVSPQELPQPVFYTTNNKLKGIKNSSTYYSQFTNIITDESESTIKNLKNNLYKQNKNNNNNDNLRNVQGNEEDTDYMNFKEFMTAKDKIIN